MKDGESVERKKIEMPVFLIVTMSFFFATSIYNDYSIAPILPMAQLSYIISFGLLYELRADIFQSLVVKIILISWFIRLVVAPFIYVLSGYRSFIVTGSGEAHINEATLLLIFELFVTTLLLMTSKKIDGAYGETSLNKTIFRNSRVKSITLISILTLIIMAVWCVLKNRDVLAIITSVFTKLKNDKMESIARRNILLNLNGTRSVPYRLFGMCIFYLQILIPAWLLTLIISKSNKVSKKEYLLALLVVVFSGFVTTDDNRDTVCLVLACLVVVYSKYKEQLKNKMPILFGVFILFASSFFLTKTNIDIHENDAIANVSSTISTYFSSIPYVSASFDVKYENRLDAIFGDAVSGVPYLVYFFKGHETSVAAFNTVVHGYSGKTNIIMPLISYGYQYFFVLAPILTVFTYYIAICFEEKFVQTSITFNKVIYAVIFVNLSLAPCTLGFPSILHRCCFYIPLVLLTNANEEESVKE